jgi:Ran GTPase-activating protein (RanGAP) involved in mRNA processing and transport
VSRLEPLLAWLRTGTATAERQDFPTGTALPDGRLDLCKSALGPDDAARVTEALRPGVVKHLLLGTDGLGDGAADVAGQAVEREVETLYLGCNGITAGGVCRIADNLRMSPQAGKVTGVWLKRNPIGDGDAAAAIVASARSLRTLDLVQTDLDSPGVASLVAAIRTAAGAGRRIERLYLGGNPLGPAGAAHLAALLAADVVTELYVSAARLGDEGAHTIADALKPGRLRRISLASNGIGPQATARLVIAAARAGVEVCDLGRVKAARVLDAPDNRLDEAATTAIAAALAERPHGLRYLVLSNTGLGSRAAHRLLDGAHRAATPTRFVLGQGVATSIRRRLDLASAAIPERPPVPADVAAVRSVHRGAGDAAS